MTPTETLAAARRAVADYQRHGQMGDDRARWADFHALRASLDLLSTLLAPPDDEREREISTRFEALKEAEHDLAHCPPCRLVTDAPMGASEKPSARAMERVAAIWPQRIRGIGEMYDRVLTLEDVARLMDTARAEGRVEEREAVVAWLNSAEPYDAWHRSGSGTCFTTAAEAIARGAHLPDTPPATGGKE